MKPTVKCLNLIVVTFFALVSFTCSRHAGAQTETLCNLQSYGTGPMGTLYMDAKGNLYGTNTAGGTNGSNGGDVFKLTPATGGNCLTSGNNWTQTVLYSFGADSTDGTGPQSGVIADSKGNLYGTTYSGGLYGYGTVFELSPANGGTYTENILYNFADGTDSGNPNGGLILDAEGNLYGTTTCCFYGPPFGTAYELSPPAGGGQWTINVIHSFGAPGDGIVPQAGLTFDGQGNLYGTTAGPVPQGGVGGDAVIFELSPAGGGQWNETILYAFPSSCSTCSAQGGVILDPAGNIYGTVQHGASSTEHGFVFELTPTGSVPWTMTVLHQFPPITGPGNDSPDGASLDTTMYLDAQGNLYGTTAFGGPNGEGTVFELSPAGNGTWTEQILNSFDDNGGSGGPGPYYEALIADPSGNLYGTTNGDGAVSEGSVFEVLAAGLPKFSLAAGIYSSSQTLTISDSMSNAAIYYTINGQTPTTASTRYSGAITVSASETVKAFATLAGYPNSAVVSAAYAIGSIATLTTPAPDSTLTGSNVTFDWTAGSGATGYAIWIGSTGVGSNNLYSTGVHTATSATVTGLPVNGETIYVRLWTSFNGTLKSNDYVYTAATNQALLSSPAPSSTLIGPNVTFSWSTVAGATGYAIWIGSTGVGSNNVYSTGIHATSSAAVTGLPTTGGTVYVRLWTSMSGTLIPADYTFTAASQATFTSPTPSSTLAGPSVNFTWTTATGSPSGYAIWIGSTGAGSNDLYSTGVHSNTSAAVTGLPTTGGAIYVRLWTSFGGTLVFTDYTYTAATRAAMTSPMSGSTLAGANVTFSWSAATGAPSGYAIWIGSTGAGSNNLYATGVHTTTSASVTNLPTNGETIYVRLWTSFNGTLVSTDYTYSTQ